MKDGNQKFFMEAYESCHDEFLRYCSVISYGRMEVQDLIQDVLLSAYKNFDSIQDKEKLLHYLIKAARNRAITEKQKENRQTRLSAYYANKLLYAGVSPETLMDVQIIYESLKLLPENQATALWLFEVQGLKMREIASIMDSTEASVKMQVSRARKKICMMLSDDKNKKRRYSIVPLPIKENQSESKPGLVENWVEIIKDIPPQIDLNHVEAIISRFQYKSMFIQGKGNRLAIFASVAGTMAVLLFFFMTGKKEEKRIVPPIEEISNGNDGAVGPLSASRQEKALLLPLALLQITTPEINAPLTIPASTVIRQPRKESQKIGEEKKTKDKLQPNFGEFSISGDWKSKGKNLNDCVELTFSESGTYWLTRWKFNECFQEQDLERLLRETKGHIVLERDAGQIILTKGRGRENGTFEFRPNKSFQSYLLDRGFAPEDYPDKEVSVKGSSKYTGKGKPVLTAKHLEVLWFKVFVTNIDAQYINYLEYKGYGNEQMHELWDLADQEVTIDYLKEILPYKNITTQPLSLFDIAELKMQEVAPSLVQRLHQCEIGKLTVEDIISINQQEIPLGYIENLCKSSFKIESAEQINQAYLTRSLQVDKGGVSLGQETGQHLGDIQILGQQIPQGNKPVTDLSSNILSISEIDKKEIIALSEFDKLVVSGNVKVGVAKYHKDQAIIVGNQSMRERVRVKLNNNTLHISQKPGFQSKNKYDVIVTGRNIQDLAIRGRARTYGVRLEQGSKDTLSSYIKRKMASEKIVGYQALVIKNGEKDFELNGGFLKSGEPKEVDENSVFMIASLMKPIYALALMRLVDQGSIDLDRPIDTYLDIPFRNPNFPEEVITPRMLLSHTSSVKDNWNVLGPMYHPDYSSKEELTINKFVDAYFRQNGKYFDSEKNFQDKPPGQVFEYSNAGYILIGHLIETVTSRSMEEFCKKEVFGPLGMKNTFWYFHDIPNQNIASPHALVDDKVQPLSHYGYPSFPEGQIRTTVGDYSKLIALFLNMGKLEGKPYLSSNSFEEFMIVQYPSLDPHQLIAWNRNEFQSEEFYRKVPRLPAHTGLEAGATTACLFDVKSKSAVLVFNNTQPNGFEGLLEIFTALCERAGLTKSNG